MTYFTMNPILIAAAVIPAIILLVRVYKADKLDREPPGLLISLVLFGILSTLIALMLEHIGMWLLPHFVTEDTILYNALLYFGVVAFSEEGAKYLLLKKRTWNHYAFNCQFDGVVYAVFVSLGFALWENISYVAGSGLWTALIRSVTAMPGHACFGVFMGVFYGAAKRMEGMRNEQSAKRLRKAALLLPAFMHGAYDFLATIPLKRYSWFFAAFILGMFIFCYKLVKRASADDHYIAQPFEEEQAVWGENEKI
ncbi:MAG: PrsW family intramembrane metalloprotease [Clostridia bacterium]|nr:PrsW family intramembrane metalloprotease [Clostridia bacterium]